jgi:hypothetical protein
MDFTLTLRTDEQHEAMHQEIVQSTTYVFNGVRYLNVYAVAWVEYNLK